MTRALDLRSGVFDHADKLAGSGGDLLPVDLLEFYTELIRNWSTIFTKKISADNDLNPETLCLGKLLDHAGVICLQLIQVCPVGISQSHLLISTQNSSDSRVLIDAILCFYEVVSILRWENIRLQIVLPPDPLVYLCVFACDSVAFSRICGIFANYRNALVKSMDSGRDYPVENTNHFNGFVMDICNCLWRNRAFTAADGEDNRSAKACTLPE